MKIDPTNPSEEIAKARPNLKPNTVKQYETNLKKLKKMFNSEDYDFLSDSDKVMDKIKDLHYTSQRNHLNAIIVLLMALNSDKKFDKLLEKYSKIRDDFNDKYTDDQKTGIISDKQSANFTTIEAVYEMINKMGEELKPIKKKETLSNKEKSLLQAYILFNIYARLPMRNDMSGAEAIQKRVYNKLSEEDKKAKNYLVVEKSNMFFVLNKYKTSKKYEELKIDLPKDLKKLLRYYLKINGMGVLFTTSTGKPITRNGLTQFLTKYSMKYMDGKKISTTILRKIYLSSKYGDMKEELEKDNKVMGHSKEVALDSYVKKPQ